MAHTACVWCPDDFEEGIKAISVAISSCNKEMAESICILIANFVIGDKWPYYVLIKRDDGGYERIDIYPNELADSLYKTVSNKLSNASSFDEFVLLNRNNCRKLLKDKSLFEQNVVNGTKFEITSNFKGKGRIYHMW